MYRERFRTKKSTSNLTHHSFVVGKNKISARHVELLQKMRIEAVCAIVLSLLYLRERQGKISLAIEAVNS